MRHFLPYFCAVVLFAACSTERRELRSALRAAGDNRPQLEAVLDHYSRPGVDGLKLRAAEYLIRYMPLHRSYDLTIEELHDRIDSMIPCYDNADSLNSAISALYNHMRDRIEVVPDVRTVTADYLIRNIEQAFDLWRKKPWAGHLDFDEFCEYLLPYKCVDMQPLTDWRTELAGLYNGELGKHPSEVRRNNPRTAVEDVNRELYKLRRSYTAEANPCPVFRATTITRLPKGTCTENCIAAAQVMRGKGIPVSIDFTPNWATRPKSHYWMTVLNQRHQDEIFAGYTTGDAEAYFADRPLAKVFRMTYRPNPEVRKILEKEGWMPPSLPCLFARDVTEEYTRVDTIECPIYDLPQPDRTIYLAVFDNQDWVPVFWGKRHRGKVRFEKVGRNVFYMPVVFDERRTLSPAGDPFYLERDGTMRFFRPDTLQRHAVRLFRKYGIYESIDRANRLGSLMGGAVEAADNPQFHNARRVFELPLDSLVLAGTELIEPADSFRYWRIRSTTSMWCDIAELHFYDGDERLHARLFCDVTDEKSKARVLMIDDDNLLTFTPMREPNIRIGFDFGRPVRVTKALWFRRADGNNVYPGYDYTLYYWVGRKWTALASRKALDQTWLDFDGVPEGALLLLVCDTRGTENRPFTYRNGVVEWM